MELQFCVRGTQPRVQKKKEERKRRRERKEKIKRSGRKRRKKKEEELKLWHFVKFVMHWLGKFTAFFSFVCLFRLGTVRC